MLTREHFDASLAATCSLVSQSRPLLMRGFRRPPNPGANKIHSHLSIRNIYVLSFVTWKLILRQTCWCGERVERRVFRNSNHKTSNKFFTAQPFAFCVILMCSRSRLLENFSAGKQNSRLKVSVASLWVWKTFFFRSSRTETNVCEFLYLHFFILRTEVVKIAWTNCFSVIDNAFVL